MLNRTKSKLSWLIFPPLDGLIIWGTTSLFGMSLSLTAAILISYSFYLVAEGFVLLLRSRQDNV